MLAERADKIFGKFICFVNITANCAYIALLGLCFGLGLNVLVIVIIAAMVAIINRDKIKYYIEEKKNKSDKD